LLPVPRPAAGRTDQQWQRAPAASQR